LGVFDTPSGAGVLALHPHGVDALLQITGFIDYQHGIGITQMITDVGP
jgi:hypothetical protein